MDFVVDQKGLPDSISVLVQDGINLLFQTTLLSEDNTIHGWHARLQRMDSKKLEDLLDLLPQMPNVRVSKQDHDTYLTILDAVFRLLGEFLLAKTSAPDNVQRWKELYTHLEQFLFHFKVANQLPSNDYYEVVLSRAGKTMLEIRIPRDKFNKSPVQASQAMLEFAYQNDPEAVRYFIDHYINFQESVAVSDTTTIFTFFNLSKALINCLKQDIPGLRAYISLVPDICTFIVEHEQDIEEQKVYLEQILDGREIEEHKIDRLNKIINTIRTRLPQQVITSSGQVQRQQDANRQLIQVISILSDHFLKLYDLDKSSDFWDKVKAKDAVLKFFLALHRRPVRFLALQVLSLTALLIFAYFHWSMPTHFPSTSNFISWEWLLVMIEFIPLLYLLLLFIFLTILLIAVMIGIFYKSKRWLYSQLLLPRILGAAVVGLVPLLLSNQAWLIGIQSNITSWLLLSLLTYIGSYVYMFIEVYKTMQFVQGQSLENALRVSTRIFCIASFETLSIVTIVTTLVFPAISKSLTGLNTDILPIHIDLPWLSFDLFPTLILLWSGFALFIGSFVQLLWQEKRITDTV